MNKWLVGLAAAALVVLGVYAYTAQTNQSAETTETSPASDRPAMEDANPETTMQRGAYQDFQSSVLTDGKTKVLFFAAAWCPECRAHDQKLQAWYPSDDLLPVYKVDYDNSSELKSRYGVVQQHTFVKVDGQGNKIDEVTGPGNDGLRAFIAP
jgi:thiol-disulfide isomerase/thioredoxin